MSYQCLDCSFKGKQFPGGSCPACGSRNVKRSQEAVTAQEKKKESKANLIIMIVCWVTLTIVLGKKLIVG